MRWLLRQLAFTVMSVTVLFGSCWLFMWAEAAFKARGNVSDWLVSTTAADAPQDPPRTAATIMPLQDSGRVDPDRPDAVIRPGFQVLAPTPKAPAKSPRLQDGERVDPLDAVLKPGFRISPPR